MKKTSRFFGSVLALMLIVNFKILAQPGNLSTPYCMPLNSQCPCNNPGPSNAPGNFINDFIHCVMTFSANVDINNLNSGCNSQVFPSIGCKNYMYHKCQHNLSVSPGQVISFSIQVGQIYPQGVAAWIDWNADNLFSAAPEKIGWSATTIPGGGWLTFTTTIPPTQANGIYRLRVRCAQSISGGSIDPCLNVFSGETEDYDVYVGTTSPVISNVVASSNSTLCSGNTLSFSLTYTSQCTPSYTWVGPNAFLSNAQNPTIVNAMPANSGNYTLTVTCGTACPVVVTTSVTIGQSPTTANAGSAICTCATATTLNANVPSVGTGSWTLISGALTITNPTLANTGVTAIGVGTNVIQWTITNGNCVSSSTVAVIRDANPTTSAAGPSQTLICTGNTATMQANTPAIGIGTWSLVSGSGTFVSPNSPTSAVTGIGTGTNVYMWIISNNTYCNCQPSSSSTMVVINYINVPINVVASPTAVCTGSNSTITASGATSYTWTGTTFTGSINQSSIVIPTGTFIVQGSSGSCVSNSVLIVVPQSSNPTISAVSSSSLLCSGNQATLTANGGTSYTWMPSGNGSSIAVAPSTTSSYTVTGADANGCTSTFTITQNVSSCTGIVPADLKAGEISLYPNPVKDKLTILSNSQTEIKLIDIAGKEILRQKVSEETHINWGGGSHHFYFIAEISTAGLSKGVYFVEIIGSSAKPLKLIKD
jgi:hypothetical protein